MNKPLTLGDSYHNAYHTLGTVYINNNYVFFHEKTHEKTLHIRWGNHITKHIHRFHTLSTNLFSLPSSYLCHACDDYYFDSKTNSQQYASSSFLTSSLFIPASVRCGKIYPCLRE